VTMMLCESIALNDCALRCRVVLWGLARCCTESCRVVWCHTERAASCGVVQSSSQSWNTSFQIFANMALTTGLRDYGAELY